MKLPILFFLLLSFGFAADPTTNSISAIPLPVSASAVGVSLGSMSITTSSALTLIADDGHNLAKFYEDGTSNYEPKDSEVIIRRMAKVIRDQVHTLESLYKAQSGIVKAVNESWQNSDKLVCLREPIVTKLPDGTWQVTFKDAIPETKKP